MSTPTHTDNNNEFTIEDILWNDEKLYKWVQFQLTQNLGFARAFEENTLEEAFIFNKPITIRIKGKKHLLNSVVGYLNIESQWYKTPIQLDADMAIFDYISNKYVLPPGQFKTHLSGLNILEKEGEKVCYSEVKDNWGFNNLVGRSFVFLYEGLNFKTEHCKGLTQHVSERKLIKPK